MPVYIVTGKLGSGKTLAMVGRMQDYICAGKQVASNIDVNIREMCGNRPSKLPVRLPDRPTFEDLDALGTCHDTCREELNGAIFLDECGTWLNSREWSGKGRQQLIDWLLHSRKRGWDVFFVIQSLSLMDKQIRDALAEYVVTCKRLDRLKIPIIGSLIRIFTLGRKRGMMPKLHVATVYYGVGPTAMVSEAWRYRGVDLYPCYSSAQIIRDDDAGQYSCTWYETPEEVAARAALLPRPKHPDIERIARSKLSADRKLYWARMLLAA
jgi:hypothetical protein